MESVNGRIHASNLCPIEEVKDFAENFNLGLFTNRESSRNPQIEILNRRLMVEVTRQQREALRTAGTVNTAARCTATGRGWEGIRRTGSSTETKRDRTNRASQIPGVTCSREPIEDWRDGPVDGASGDGEAGIGDYAGRVPEESSVISNQ